MEALAAALFWFFARSGALAFLFTRDWRLLYFADWWPPHDVDWWHHGSDFWLFDCGLPNLTAARHVTGTAGYTAPDGSTLTHLTERTPEIVMANEHPRVRECVGAEQIYLLIACAAFICSV
jgi:hypothetical protein